MKELVMSALTYTFDVVGAVMDELQQRLPLIVLLWLIYHALVK